MKLATCTAIFAIALASCSRKEVCELEFRAANSHKPAATELAAACEVLHRRLANDSEIALGHVVPAGASAIVLRLTREPDAETLARLTHLGEHLGQLRILVVADSHTPGFDEVAERRRFDAWRSAHEAVSIAVFNQLSAEQGGPSASIEW